MEYRAAVEADAPMLAEINRQLIEDEWGSGMSLERLEERMRRWLAEGEYRAFLFLEEGEPVAYTLVAADEESAFIRHFFVFRAHRGRGVGRRAIEILFRDIVPPTARVTLDVLASNRGGLEFWRAVGFTDYAVRMQRLPAGEAAPAEYVVSEEAGAGEPLAAGQSARAPSSQSVLHSTQRTA